MEGKRAVLTVTAHMYRQTEVQTVAVCISPHLFLKWTCNDLLVLFTVAGGDQLMQRVKAL